MDISMITHCNMKVITAYWSPMDL